MTRGSASKSEMTMGHFTREVAPFYYALADAFTICDAYHCSIFGPTSPNRNFLFTGTSGLSAGYSGALAVKNAVEELSECADPGLIRLGRLELDHLRRAAGTRPA